MAISRIEAATPRRATMVRMPAPGPAPRRRRNTSCPTASTAARSGPIRRRPAAAAHWPMFPPVPADAAMFGGSGRVPQRNPRARKATLPAAHAPSRDRMTAAPVARYGGAANQGWCSHVAAVRLRQQRRHVPGGAGSAGARQRRGPCAGLRHGHLDRAGRAPACASCSRRTARCSSCSTARPPTRWRWRSCASPTMPSSPMRSATSRRMRPARRDSIRAAPSW